MDLSNDRDLDDYARNGPRDYQKLHRLHDSVNKGPAVPLISSKKATFSYRDGKNRIVSSFAIANKNLTNNAETSSDYDGGWIDEFPSPSEILGIGKNCMGTVSTTAKTQKSDLQAVEDDISDLELELFETQKLAHPVNRGKSDIADASASIIGGVINHQEVDKKQEYIKQSSVKRPNFDQSSLFTSDDGLFSSTLSPGKPLSPPGKRQSTHVAEAGNCLNEAPPVAKRRKVSMQPSGQVPDSSIAEIQASPVVQQSGLMIQKSGRPRPAWVNDFDPEFIAEYADFVEFI